MSKESLSDSNSATTNPDILAVIAGVCFTIIAELALMLGTQGLLLVLFFLLLLLTLHVST